MATTFRKADVTTTDANGDQVAVALNLGHWEALEIMIALDERATRMDAQAAQAEVEGADAEDVQQGRDHAAHLRGLAHFLGTKHNHTFTITATDIDWKA